MPALCLELARAGLRDGKLDEARQQLAALRQDFPQSDEAKEAAELDAEVLCGLYRQAAGAGQGESAAAFYEELLQQHPTSPWAVQARTYKHGLVPEEGEAVLSDAGAYKRFEEAKNLLENLDFSSALDALQEVVRRSESKSTWGQRAKQKLPECLYLWALHSHGEGKREESMARLRALALDFPDDEWGEKASVTLDRIENTPEGMVYVPEGKFEMGTSLEQIRERLQQVQPLVDMDDPYRLEFEALIFGLLCETPPQIAPTGAFYIDRTEVTNRQYKAFLEADGRRSPANWPEEGLPEEEGDKPVVVRFVEARAYAEWAGKRLPTEAEWEKAARGTDGRLYPWGETFEKSRRCRHMLEPDAGPMPVGSFPDGASPYGCLDMIGNVMEWTKSWFDAYPGADHTDASYGENYIVARGGMWGKQEIVEELPARCASRYPLDPALAYPYTGFRCVRDVK